MITIQIEDNKLEKKILAKAKAFGMSVQDLVNDLLRENVDTIEKDEFEIPQLDYRNHSSIITNSFTEEEQKLLKKNDSKPFSQIDDAAKYTHELRRKS